MSKLLWKALLVSPVLLGVTLVTTGSTVRATESAIQRVADSQAPTQAASPLTVEAQKSEVQ